MRKTVTTLATAALVAAGIAAAPTATASGTPGCATEDEYNTVQLGWTRHKVEATFEMLHGRLNGDTNRPYHICRPGSSSFGTHDVWATYVLDDAGRPRLAELSAV